MKYTLLILSIVFVIAGCKKLEVPATKEDMLRASEWQLDTGWVRTIIKADGDQNPASIDKTDPYVKQECETDDKLIFRENHEGAHIPGEMTCSINETAEVQFSWGITDAGEGMYIYDAKEFFGIDVNAEILEFYEDRFALRYSEYKSKEILVNGNSQGYGTDTTIYTMYFKKI